MDRYLIYTTELIHCLHKSSEPEHVVLRGFAAVMTNNNNNNYYLHDHKYIQCYKSFYKLKLKTVIIIVII